MMSLPDQNQERYDSIFKFSPTYHIPSPPLGNKPSHTMAILQWESLTTIWMHLVTVMINQLYIVLCSVLWMYTIGNDFTFFGEQITYDF